MISQMPPDGFEEEAGGPPDGFEDAVATPAAPPMDPLQRSAQAIRSVGNRVGQFLEPAMRSAEPYLRSQFGSPVDLAQRGDQLIRKGFTKGGEFIAEESARGGANPYFAAALGTAAQMTPDIVEAAVVPQGQLAPSKKILRPISEPMAERAAGFTKMLRKTPFARGKARQAARVALDNDVFPVTGNPIVAEQNAMALGERAGQKIGAMREAAGSNPIDPVFDSLEAARQQATQGLKGGAWDAIHRKFDEAQETLLSLANQGADVPLAAVEKTKNLLSRTVNWLADNVSQETAKQISRAIEGGVENIMRSKGIDMAAYKAQKGIFGAAKHLQKGLANEVAAQTGNNAVSLPTAVVGAGQLATGNPAGALAAMGVWEGLRRRGSGIGARLLEEADRNIVPQMRARILKPTVAAMGHTGRLLNPGDPIKAPIEVLGEPVNPVAQVTDRAYGPAAYQPDASEELVGGPNNQGNKQGNKNNNNRDFESEQDQETSKEAYAKEYLQKAKGDEALARRLALEGLQEPEKVLTPTVVRRYLKKAHNDPKKARRMALADGWTIPPNSKFNP